MLVLTRREDESIMIGDDVEVKVLDLFYVQEVPFFPVTKLDVFALYPMAMEVKVMAELAYVQGDAVRAFYEKQLAD